MERRGSGEMQGECLMRLMMREEERDERNKLRVEMSIRRDTFFMH